MFQHVTAGMAAAPEIRARDGVRRAAVVTTGVLLALLAGARAEAGQIGAMLSPGALSKAHKQIEGIQCAQCHETARKVTAARCLTCHKPIAERIAAKKGVHRAAGECVACHTEHGGTDKDIRPIDRKTFDHAKETGFPLTGVHAKPAADCATCHKSHTFLDVKAACATCHKDPHRGALGTACATCHNPDTGGPFKNARTTFNHATAKFQLTGAHTRVACEKCHTQPTFRGLQFASCASCHQEPHEKRFGAVCTTCHTPEGWNTRTVEHAKTRFPLAGAHQRVECTKCHTTGKLTADIPFATCATCHSNPHKASITGACNSCHTEQSFKGGTFDHTAKTAFRLEGKHEALACVKCHTTVSDESVPYAQRVADFGGLHAECVACHADKDPHKGQFGRACDSCHRPTGFPAKDFRHPREPAFFSGQHTTLTCEKCHKPDQAVRPAKAASPQMACATCHTDAHLGQLAQACDQCHAITGEKFKAVAFSHDRARFHLTGTHTRLDCAKCHVTETRPFPAATGKAIVFKPIEPACATCHKDPHLGQFQDQRCESCHSTGTFKMGGAYIHQELESFFKGFHRAYACKDCHKQQRGRFPGGEGVAVRYRVGRTCQACHDK